MPVTLSLTVNGKKVTADVDSRTLLVDFLRNDLGLTGTHVGCDTGQCGACTVHLDGNAVKACTILAAQAQRRRRSLTIEGLAAADGTMHPMQAAFKECHGLQCGFCTPGMVMSAIDLVNRHPKAPTSRRSAKSSKATSAAAPATTTSSRRCSRAPPRWASRRARWVPTSTASSAQSVRRKEDYRFLTGAGQFTDDVTIRRTRRTRTSCARRTRTRRSARSTRRRRRRAPGVVAIFTGADLDGRQRPALRLAHHRHRRQADERAAASGAGARQGPLRRRPGRAGDRGNAGPGEGRRRADRRRLRRAAGGRQLRRRAEAGRAADPRRRAGQQVLHVGAGRQGGGRRRVRQGRARDEARHRQQPAHPERDRAARGGRVVQPRRRRATRSTSPARTRTSSGC